MSSTSQWPLSEQSIRFVAPTFLVKSLQTHPLTCECFPTAMGYYPSAVGHFMRRSHPDDYLLFYCVEGQGSLKVEEALFQIKAGDVVLLRQGLAHEYAASTDHPWSLYWVHFQGRAAESFLTHMSQEPNRPHLFAGVSPSLIAQFKAILATRHTGYSTPAFIHASNQLRLLFTEIALKAQAPRSEPESLNVEVVQRFMRENLHRALTLETIASVAGLSKFHFSKRYRALTGYSPIRHFNNMKMEAACRLLDASGEPIQSIARSLAFEDALYFSRVFRKIIGCSPREYRASSVR